MVLQLSQFRKAFHPSHSLGLHTLEGICYIVICHCLHSSLPTVSCVQVIHAHVRQMLSDVAK